MINIFIYLFSFGILSRGLIYKVLSMYKVNNKLKLLSFSKSDNELVNMNENLVASKIYIFIGLVTVIFMTIVFFTYKELFSSYSILIIVLILLLDFLTGFFVKVKLQLDEYDKSNDTNK